MLLEDLKKTAEKLTGMGRPSPGQARAQVRARKAQTWMFKDNGLIPTTRPCP